MAREEHAKEDLLRQATGLAERAELVVPSFAEPIVVGFRDGQAASVYFGEEPVYHWNFQGQLRRAYLAGKLVKAEQGRLVSWRKQRDAGQVQMIREEFTTRQQTQFLEALDAKLNQLHSALRDGQFELVGQVSQSHPSVVQLTLAWLEHLPRPLRIADVPNVAG
jgi:hypothetical protein